MNRNRNRHSELQLIDAILMKLKAFLANNHCAFICISSICCRNDANMKSRNQCALQMRLNFKTVWKLSARGDYIWKFSCLQLIYREHEKHKHSAARILLLNKREGKQLVENGLSLCKCLNFSASSDFGSLSFNSICFPFLIDLIILWYIQCRINVPSRT